MYSVPSGNSFCGIIKSCTERIFPVCGEITIVPGVSFPPWRMVREETITIGSAYSAELPTPICMELMIIVCYLSLNRNSRVSRIYLSLCLTRTVVEG